MPKEEEFLAYCFIEPNGWHSPAVHLYSPLEILRYCRLQSQLFREIRVTDTDDFVCWQVIDKKLVYPTEKEGLSRYAIDNIEAYFRGEKELPDNLGA